MYNYDIVNDKVFETQPILATPQLPAGLQCEVIMFLSCVQSLNLFNSMA